MTGPEHYREAEKDIDLANKSTTEENQRYYLGRAQVHATVALAAATALAADEALPDAWYEVLDA